MQEADLRFPIGRFVAPSSVDSTQRQSFIEQIAAAPAKLRDAVARLDDAQLDTPYREGGWTVRQVAHHLPDSHLNAYVRFKLALTEDAPAIKSYEEALWAELDDAKLDPIDGSLALLDAIHRRWVASMRRLPGEAFERTFRHPEIGLMSLNHQLALYAWHGRHHVAHITALRERMRW